MNKIKKVSLCLIFGIISGCSGVHSTNYNTLEPYPSSYYNNGTPQHNPTINSTNSTINLPLN